ncbi:uncharacterized protein LOC126671396 [Mercurialis annua]|uniref:uncharacterized protein LOC126671396 n=1 Tax=Mercurialis annua TaxID=3986 RepID=UPI00215F44EA|nr:uncharacterized protein LOC126671396 [Mercurialis annua]
MSQPYNHHLPSSPMARTNLFSSEITSATMKSSINSVINKPQKPFFRPAQDDTKPPLQDPILRSDPIETEEAVLRLPPFPSHKFKLQS